jgi:predicted nucleic acid-binding protein
MVVVDATFLLLMLNPLAKVPGDKDGAPITLARERMELLVRTLSKSRTAILIPTPALSEVLMTAKGSIADLVAQINKFSVFEVVPFDQNAAIEVAEMARSEQGQKSKREKNTTYAKLKYDRQIVAIAKVKQATVIYSDDGDVRSLGKRYHISVDGLADLPLPPKDPQMDLLKDTVERNEKTGIELKPATPVSEVSDDGKGG